MKKGKVLATSFGLGLVAFLTACGAPEQPPVPQPGPDTGTPGEQVTVTPGAEGPGVAAAPAHPSVWSIDPNDARLVAEGIEVRDGNLWFTEPRTISVGLWDRSHDRIPVFAESYWAEWIQSEIAATHNIIVEWSTIPRWSESDHQSTLLAAGNAPDIGYTFNNPMVTSFAEMGGIMNMYPLLQEYRDLLPHMYDFLAENIYWNFNPLESELWSITGRLAQHGRLNAFIREDWLNTLGLPVPNSLEQFEETLIAFRDNQDLLFPDRTRSLIPFQVHHDVGWTAGLIFESFIPENVSEREWFRYGFDDRRFMFADAAREGSRVLNRWFHDGLLWEDFFLHEPGDPTGDNLARLGYVGSFIQNWDQPFRPGENLLVDMRDNIGPDANWLAIQPFASYNFLPNPTDRFIFFPITNQEPLASLIYLDFINRADVQEKLMFGVEDIHYVMVDGSRVGLPDTEEDPWPDYMVIPSGLNFDITMTANGAILSQAVQMYPGTSPEQVLAASAIALQNPIRHAPVQVGTINAEDGMSTPLAEARDVLLHTVIANTSPEDFDAVFTQMYNNYLALGGAAIIAERDAAWVAVYGEIENRN